MQEQKYKDRNARAGMPCIPAPYISALANGISLYGGILFFHTTGGNTADNVFGTESKYNQNRYD